MSFFSHCFGSSNQRFLNLEVFAHTGIAQGHGLNRHTKSFLLFLRIVEKWLRRCVVPVVPQRS